MNTATGKRLAARRDEFLHSFLDEFYAEWDGNR
jgi:HD superfamily phosphodiesterase